MNCVVHVPRRRSSERKEEEKTIFVLLSNSKFDDLMFSPLVRMIPTCLSLVLEIFLSSLYVFSYFRRIGLWKWKRKSKLCCFFLSTNSSSHTQWNAGIKREHKLCCTHKKQQQQQKITKKTKRRRSVKFLFIQRF